MSEISDMIQRLCPDGVEYRKLGEVVQMNRGVRVVKNDLQISGQYPVFQNSLTPLGQYNQYNYDANTSFVISAGAAGEIGFSKTRFWAADDCLVITPCDKIVSKFIFYYLMSQQPYIKSQVRKASIPRLSKDVIYNLEIPVPPLEVQRKIVEVLDNFSDFTAVLIAELTAELEARKKQYECYRDSLLNFSQITPPYPVKWMKLGEICTLSRGKVISKDYLRENAGCYPVYSSQTANNGELGKINTYDYDGQYLTWTTDGAYAGTVFKRKGKFSITNVCGLITINTKDVNYDYLYYWLSIEAPKHVYQGMGNPKLMSNVMGTILIPIPPLAEQERIVSILDRFEALTTDLTSGLPAEIKARQQQYEYYRDQLLTFKRAN